MRKNISIISSPLQLLNSIEYFKNSKYRVEIISLGNNNNLNTIVNICERLSLDFKIHSSFFKDKSYIISSIVVFLKLIPIILNAKKILIGDFREFHNKALLFVIKKIKVPLVLLDDGNSNIYYKNEILNLSTKNKYLEIFSVYEIGHLEPRNDYKFLKKNFFNKEVSNFDIIIGSSVVQNNALSEKDYFDLLKKISVDKSKAIYIPHRNESNDQLQKIVNKGFVVVNLNLPVELYILNGIGVKSIHSLCSSAIINLDILLSNIVINLYILDSKWISSKIGNKMKDIEQSYKLLVSNSHFNNNVNLL